MKVRPRCQKYRILMAESGGRGGETPRQPKSVNFQTKGLSTICHFLAPWESLFLHVKWLKRPRAPETLVFYGVWGARVPKTGEDIYCCGSPHPKKLIFAPGMCVCFRPCFSCENDHRRKYVCICVHPCVCFCAIRVCYVL